MDSVARYLWLKVSHEVANYRPGLLSSQCSTWEGFASVFTQMGVGGVLFSGPQSHSSPLDSFNMLAGLPES